MLCFVVVRAVLGIQGVSFARSFENRALGAESAGLSVSRDSECLPGVSGFEGDSDESREELEDEDDDEEEEEDEEVEDEEDEDESSAFVFFFFFFFVLSYPQGTLLAACYGISLGGQFFPSFGPHPFNWNWYGSHLFCGSQGLFPCSGCSIVPCSCGNSTTGWAGQERLKIFL